MITVSSGFKNSIKQPTVISDGKVDIVNSSGKLSFGSDSISRIEVYGSAFQNDKVLGNLAQHSLTIEILGDLTKSISLVQENVVKPYIGVKVGSSFEYVKYQDFLITEITYSDTTNLTKILATDSLVKLNKEYTDTNTYPLTLKSYLENVLTSCGLSLENTTFFNDTFSLTEQKIPNLTLARDIVSKVAELALCFVTINKVTNKVELKKAFDPFTRGYTYEELSAYTYEELSSFTYLELSNEFPLTNDIVTKSNYWNFKLSDHWFGNYGINTLTLKNSQVEGESNSIQDSGYVNVDGVVELSIVDNPFINTESLRLSVIDSMFTEVLNYKYYPFSLDYIGFPYLEIGDIVGVNKINDFLFGSPIYEYSIKYDGGLVGRLVSKALSRSEIKYYNTQTVSQRVKAAEVVIDKVQGEVTIIAGDYYDGKLSGTYYNFNGIGFTMTNSNDDTVFFADSNGNLTLTGNIKSTKNDILRVELNQEFIKFYDENSNVIGHISSIADYTGYETFYLSTTEEYGSLNGSSGIRMYQTILNGNTYSDVTIETNSEYNTNYSNIINYSLDNQSYVQMSTNNSLNSTINSSIYLYTIGNYSIIDMSSSGQISIKSNSENYSLYIGGQYRTITRDANGFLKAV